MPLGISLVLRHMFSCLTRIPLEDYRGGVGEHGRRGGLGAGACRYLSPGEPSPWAASLCLFLRERPASRRDGEPAANSPLVPQV